jgi:toxin secretion/phage lysis holin
MCSGISTVFIYVFGGLDVALQCLLIAIALDYVSGMIKAYESQTLSSRIGFRGIIKKVGVLAIVALGVVIDRLTGNSGDIRTLIIYYFVANEGLSIIENLASAGVPIPAIIAKALKILKDKGK